MEPVETPHSAGLAALKLASLGAIFGGAAGPGKSASWRKEMESEIRRLRRRRRTTPTQRAARRREKQARKAAR